MKQVLAVIVAIFYLGTTSGFTLRMHYCMGRLAEIGIGLYGPKTCGKCGMPKSEENKTGCCKDENRFIKNNADQNISSTDLPSFQILTVALPAGFLESFFPIYFPEIKKYPVSHDPPRSNTVAAYLRNCVFLI